MKPLNSSTQLRSREGIGLPTTVFAHRTSDPADLLRSNDGPVVMEVDSSPRLEGVEKATGVDVAGKIIEFIEKNARPGRTHTKGKRH
ncbi:MAG: hypothetical protein P1U65_00925 [Minwuia sp.]|nr:hypothetical protein [Minwuia sp.]